MNKNEKICAYCKFWEPYSEDEQDEEEDKGKCKFQWFKKIKWHYCQELDGCENWEGQSYGN